MDLTQTGSSPEGETFLLEARGVGFQVGRKTLISHVNLGMRAGEVVALLGPNGAGKSTLLKLLCGQIPAKTGQVFFEGRLLEEWEPLVLARRRAVLPQSFAVPFEFTAREIVLLGRSPHGDATQCEAMARHAMEKTESLHLADRVVTTLSGGEMQRVQLARVLVQIDGRDARRALLLDEPISNLDPAHQHGTLEVARNLATEGVGVLVVLHDLNLAAQYADRLVVMKQGKVVADGSPREVLTQERIREVFEVETRVMPNPVCDAPAVFVSGRAS